MADRTIVKQLRISREKARALGEQTVAILSAGYYITESGVRVDIRRQVDAAVRGTVSYPPGKTPLGVSTRQGATMVEVRNETTLAAARALTASGLQTAALNFASATTPGGGFLQGARAQEEYLARSSALWSCLRDNPMYAHHRAQRHPFYTDYVLHSPDVPVLRDDDGVLLEEPYLCSIITSPAVNAFQVWRYAPERISEISPVMKTRILKVLAVAIEHGHEAIVLGAWGCGAFGNDAGEIANLFRNALEADFRGAFERVVFAVADWSEDERFIGPFLRAFGGGQVRFA